ncbi:hypothetical protein B0H19DRAFT_1076252 [Mycena capillaripes]|nr:hypothetical protein B0H19DRAFT_1076252 [Mycena capillaripes]
MSPLAPPNTNATSTTDFIRLLSRPRDDFLKYSRQEHSKWLIDMAHDICDPAAMRGSLVVWDQTARRWRIVIPTDPLTTSIYLYDVPVGIILGLSKLSTRVGKSVTTGSMTGNTSTMGDRVKRRDEVCRVTKFRDPLINSHICPKHMGDPLARFTLRNFSPVSPLILPSLSIYDEIFGLSLTKNLDAYFSKYELGLRFVSANHYECHTFMADTPGWVYTTVGQVALPTTFPILHGHNASPPQLHHATNPPPGLLRWHYLQCIIKKFVHADYKNLQNIVYSELPCQMEGDSDDDGTDSEAEWPSAVWDRGQAVQVSIKDDEWRRRVIADWVMKV